METKLEAARIANQSKRAAVIANGRTPGDSSMHDLLSGQTVGTLFVPGKRR